MCGKSRLSKAVCLAHYHKVYQSGTFDSHAMQQSDLDVENSAAVFMQRTSIRNGLHNRGKVLMQPAREHTSLCTGHQNMFMLAL